MKRIAVALLFSSLFVACAPDPCVQRCPNDPSRSQTDVANCRAVQNNIATGTGPCAEEIRIASGCNNNNTFCNSSGRSELATTACSSKNNAALECCIRNFGRAPACAFWN
jgi:hypothetical protein